MKFEIEINTSDLMRNKDCIVEDEEGCFVSEKKVIESLKYYLRSFGVIAEVKSLND